jgi:hypothetical protein
MRRFACIASLLIAFAAPMETAAAEPGTACLQPVARFASAPNPSGPESVRLAVAPGSVVLYSDHMVSITSNDRVAKPVTIAHVGDRTVITAEQLWVPSLTGSRDGFLYDRPGARCPLDQLPKELQVAL